MDEGPGAGKGQEMEARTRTPSCDKGYKAMFMRTSREALGGQVSWGWLRGLEQAACTTAGCLANQAGKCSTWLPVRGVGCMAAVELRGAALLTPKPLSSW